MKAEWYDRTIQALQLNGKGERTQQAYARSVRMLSQFYGKAPDLITKQELQDYFLHRKNVDHWSPNTMRICYCGIRFFYEHVLQGNWHILGILRAQTEAQGDEPKGDVGTNANYLSYPPNSVIFSSLEIQFTEAVVISRNRATGAPVYPNFRTVSLVLACPQFTPLRYPVPSFMSLFISLCTNVPTRISISLSHLSE